MAENWQPPGATGTTFARNSPASTELQQLVASGRTTTNVTGRIADPHSRLAAAEQRVPEPDPRIAALERQTVTPAGARAVLADFDTLWQNLIPREHPQVGPRYRGLARSILAKAVQL